MSVPKVRKHIQDINGFETINVIRTRNSHVMKIIKIAEEEKRNDIDASDFKAREL